MTKPKSVGTEEIPLFLVPKVISRMIRDRGPDVYRISVKRTHYHHYNISVRTRTVPKELRGIPGPAHDVPAEEGGIA